MRGCRSASCGINARRVKTPCGNGRVQFGVQRVKSLPLTFPLAGALLALGIFSSPVSAVDVSGRVSGIWRTQDTVRVTADIELSTLDTLRIEPGVRVEFTGPYLFVVRGLLNASGTKDGMITFTMEAGVPDSLRWGGLRFIQARNGSRLNFVRIENGWARGVWPRNCGGGLFVESCNPNITRCEIVGNRADADGGGYYGWFSNATLSNVLIYNNRATNFGGGLYFSYSSPQIINCTIALDTAGAWGGGIFAGAESRPTIVNCIVTYNHQFHSIDSTNIDGGDAFTPDFGRAQSARPTVNFSNIGFVPLSPFPGSGNIFLEPEFISVTPPYDFRLQYSSPDVDAGDPKSSAMAEPDVLINRIDVGAYGGTEDATLSVPVIKVNFATLNYGSYRLNASTPKEIKIENRGHYRLFLRDFRFTSTAFYLDSTKTETGFIPSYLVAPIEPGEQAKFTIYFKPFQLGVYQESLTIISNDTIIASPRVTLNGTGINPLAVIADSLSFGPRLIDSDNSRNIYLKNNGISDLRILRDSNNRMRMTVSDPAFGITAAGDVIRPGDSTMLTVRFQPPRPESFTASAQITTNDRDVFFTTSGRGYGPKFVLPDTSARFLGYVYFNGDTAVSGVIIRNDGDENLIINSAKVGDTVAFTTALPVGGLIIPPDSSGSLIVKFHPPVANQIRNTQLTISSNYPTPSTLRLSGRGMAEPGRYVFGHVSGVWDWFAGHDDYIVLDSVYVPVNQKLKIEAGARILFEPGAAFIASGEVRAIGTPDDSIYFLPRDASGNETARWKGITLSLVDASRLTFCKVSSSRNGITIREASPRVQFSTIFDNGDSLATARGSSRGGAFRIENSGAVINGCLIDGNSAALGGAIYVLNSKPTITNCTIRNNRADDGSAIYLKFLTGGLYQSLVIDDNVAPAGFGTITVTDRSAPRFVNCTIANNTGIGMRGLVRSLPTVINSIIWGNTSGFELQNGSNALVTYSDYPGGLPANKNLEIDPGFVGSGAEPYQLSSISPLIDKGNPESTYRDYFFPPSHSTSRDDIGAYGGPLGGGWGLPEININLFQNPAFPRWCDVIISAATSFASAPVCSVEFTPGSMIPVSLTAIDASSYRGSLESPSDGSIFLTANGQMSGGLPQKIGRTFEVKLNSGSGGTIYLADLGGELNVPGGSAGPRRLIITSRGEVSVKPERAFLPISSSSTITGLGGEAVIKVPVSDYGMIDSKYGRDISALPLAIYKRESSDWVKVPGRLEYNHLVVPIMGDGEYILAIEETNSPNPPLPLTAELMEAFPNPFNGGVTITFDLTTSSKIALTIHDLTGREIGLLAAGNIGAGKHEVHWDAENGGGNPLPSGIYWARLESDNGVRSIKLLLVR